MSIFDNATQVMIGNKEVQSIITSNGGVLYEKQSGDNYLLTLTSDKDILSYYDNESALLTATLTNNNVPVSGKTIVFNADKPFSTVHVSTPGSDIGDDYYAISSKTGSHYDTIGTGSTGFIKFNSEKVSAYSSSWSEEFSHDGRIHVKNGVLTCVDSLGEEHTIDVSSINTSKLYTGDFTVEYYSYEGVTNSSGVATVSYESKGTGDLNIKVDCMNLQETYELEDCIRMYPNTYTSQSNLNYALPSTPFEVAFTLTRQSGVGYVRIGTDTNNCIIFGQVGSDASNGLARMNNGSYRNLIQSSIKPSVNAPISIKCQFDGTIYKYSIGDNTITYNDVGQALTTLILIYCTNGNSIKNLRIKSL